MDSVPLLRSWSSMLLCAINLSPLRGADHVIVSPDTNHSLYYQIKQIAIQIVIRYRSYGADARNLCMLLTFHPYRVKTMRLKLRYKWYCVSYQNKQIAIQNATSTFKLGAPAARKVNRKRSISSIPASSVGAKRKPWYNSGLHTAPTELILDTFICYKSFTPSG